MPPWERYQQQGQSAGPAGPWQRYAGAAKPYEGWGEYGTDLARTAGQGASLGFADELIAGVRAATGHGSYDEALQEERGAVERFRQENPDTALAAELAGGFAVPGLGAGRAIARVPGLVAKAAQGAKIGAGFGAAAGFGSGEGDVTNRLERAGQSALFGAGLGASLPIAGRALGIGGQRVEQAAGNVADNEAGARLYLADRLRRNGLTEQQVADELQRGQQARQFSGGAADLPETIADVAPATQRVVRGIKVGGDADDVIEPFLGQRQAGEIDFSRGAEAGGQYGRLTEQMRLAMRVSDKELEDVLESLSVKRKAEADKLFAAARDNSEAFDLSMPLSQYALRAMEIPDTGQRSLLNRALDMFTQQGHYGRYPGNQFAVNDVGRFHNAKVALDDLIGESQGNMRRLLTGMKHDLMDAVFSPNSKGVATRNADYRKALDTYASQSELLNAAELGRSFARGTEAITPRMWRAMSEREKQMVRRAWLDVQSGKMSKAAGPTTDFTNSLRAPATGDDLRLLLPPRAGTTAAGGMTNRERLGELVRREHRMSGTAQKVLGNSSTAEKAADAIDIGTMVRSLRYIKDQGGLVNAGINSLADTLEKLSAIKGERARYLARQMLSTDPAQQQAFLAQVAREYGAAQARVVRDSYDAWRRAFATSLAVVHGERQGKRGVGTGFLGLGRQRMQ